ncbi:unnamed protein product [Microthlaspi erraticum]|uniref:Retroviral polymerase SH3-like domain-containing protein n=1 Tax=Microthlaspi erraticum TaxID=1685480 RepID=A0A6D2L930_9BRAS|nr:unnamed protein product [Microthlaspi erraticum]
MIVDQGLPHKFWAEAVYTSAYLQNRLPSKAVEDDITPIEKWSDQKPTVDHLKIFGSLCFVHVPKEKRSKLDEKARRGIFIGYSSQTKGYRVLILENEMVEISRDVAFEEGKQSDWKRQREVQKVFTLPLNVLQDRDVEENQHQNNHSPVLTQPVDQHHDEEEDAQTSSTPPKKYKSMTEIM